MSYENALKLWTLRATLPDNPTKSHNLELLWTSRSKDGTHPQMEEAGAVYIRRNYVDNKRCAALLEDINRLNGFEQEFQTRYLSNHYEETLCANSEAWYIPADESDIDEYSLDEEEETTDDEAAEELLQQRAREREGEQPQTLQPTRYKRPCISSDSDE